MDLIEMEEGIEMKRCEENCYFYSSLRTYVVLKRKRTDEGEYVG